MQSLAMLISLGNVVGCGRGSRCLALCLGLVIRKGELIRASGTCLG